MKHVTTSDSVFTVIGWNPMMQESNDLVNESIKEWLREIRIEKLTEKEIYEKQN